VIYRPFFSISALKTFFMLLLRSPTCPRNVK
jgi:hypothetical protein